MREEAGSRAGTILVVDHDPTYRRVFGAVLSKAGYRILLACGGSEALARTAAAAPDVVLLDYMMPEMTGPEVISRMRSQAPMRGVSILLTSSSSLPEHIAHGLRAGADGYLVKPVQPELLRARVAAAVRISANRRHV
jgi:CheY-like chemotaxis protein